MAISDRGFASMNKKKQREIASLGGKAAHQKGVAHEWTSEEAREAGRKGGIESGKRATSRARNKQVTNDGNGNEGTQARSEVGAEQG